MSEPAPTTLDLFAATAREPDSLFDRWLEGTLDEATERAVFDQLLGSTFERDQAMVLAVIRESVARAAAARGGVLASLRVAVRRVGNALEALADSLRPLPAATVTVRSSGGRQAALSFEADTFGEGSRLSLAPAAADRFDLSIEPSQTDADDEWLLRGDEGRMVTAEPDDGVVLFRSVGAGNWSLERRHGELAVTSLVIRLEAE